MSYVLTCQPRSQRPGMAVASALSLGLLASVMLDLPAQENAFRSSATGRIWQADRRQAPRHAQRATHLGYEVSTGPIVVLAEKADVASRVAEEATSAWNAAASLANRFATIQQQPNFGQGALQVVVEQTPARGSEPAVRLANFGRVNRIQIAGGSGGADPDEQQRQLRQAAAQAFFQTAEFDQTLPSWVLEGLAGHVAGNPPKGGEGEDASRVQFLLEGNDGIHAGPFFELLQSELAAAHPDPHRKTSPQITGAPARTPASAALEQFFADRAAEYEDWKLDPEIGQPLIAAADDADEPLQASRQQMAFVLKLAQRFALQAKSGIRTRVATFEKANRQAVADVHAAPSRPPSLASIAGRLNADGEPAWATIGPDGKLVWSDERETLRELLGIDEARYEFVHRQDRWGLETTLPDGRKLTGWLEPNPENARRPLAKFAVETPD